MKFNKKIAIAIASMWKKNLGVSSIGKQRVEDLSRNKKTSAI